VPVRNFYVAVFDDGTAVAPKEWMNKARTMCKWPQGGASVERLKMPSRPEKTWLDCKVFEVIDSYGKHFSISSPPPSNLAVFILKD